MSALMERVGPKVKELAANPALRGAFHMANSSIVTSLLGYVFWLLSAHFFAAHAVGVASALVSLASGVSVFANVGLGPLLIERLPSLEGSRGWGRLVAAVFTWSAFVSAILSGLVLVAMGPSSQLGSATRSVELVAIVTSGAALITILTLLQYVFMSARSGSYIFWTNLIAAVVKLSALLLLIPVERRPTTILSAWLVSLVVGSIVGSAILIPRLGQGRLPMLSRPSLPLSVVRRAGAHHAIGVAGSVVPFAMPVIVAARLGPVPNAHFYTAWMVAGFSFLLGPAVASAVMTEGIRSPESLASSTRTALRALVMVLGSCFVGILLLGRLVLSTFGAGYVTAMGVLVVLGVSAVPDAVTSLATATLRVRGRLRAAALLNIGMAVGALVGAVVLLPVMGIVGAAVAWGASQALGAIAVAPWLRGVIRGQGLPRVNNRRGEVREVNA